MAVTAKWVAPDTIASALTTQLDSLGDGVASAASTAIDNDSDLYQYIELEIHLASLTPGSSPSVVILLQKSVDGTNYEDGSELNNAAVFTGASFSTAASAHHMCLGPLVIPPCKFKLILVNHAGAALASSGNTLKYRRFNEQAV